MLIKRLLRPTELLLLLAVLFAMLVQAPLVRNAVTAGLRLAIGSLVPSLFAFSVVAQLLVRMQLMRPLERLAAPLWRKLHLPEASLTAFLLGAAGGYPLGAQTVASLYTAGQLGKSEAEEALGFTNNCGLAYVVSVLAPILGLDLSDALKLYAVHIFAALFSAVALHWLYGSVKDVAVQNRKVPAAESFASALTASVGNAAVSMLTLSGFVCLFFVISALIRLLPVSLPNFVFGVLELSAGVAALERGDLALAAFLIGFGGVCVLCQTAAVTAMNKLRLQRYLLGKLLQGMFSVVVVRLFF